LQDSPAFDANRINAFVCDAAKDDLAQHVPERSVSIATMIFMLSAVAPTFMEDVMRNVYKACLCVCVCLFVCLCLCMCVCV
jgi:hypothetical protein